MSAVQCSAVSRHAAFPVIVAGREEQTC